MQRKSRTSSRSLNGIPVKTFFGALVVSFLLFSNVSAERRSFIGPVTKTSCIHDKKLDVDSTRVPEGKRIDGILGRSDIDSAIIALRGGGKKQNSIKSSPRVTPSIYWAVLHTWLYFLSLGFNAVNIPYLIREVVDGSANASPSSKSIALSGNVEAVDKILTFAGIAFLSALSDKYGRKPMIIWSSLGFAFTNIVQAMAGTFSNSKAATAAFFLADFIDGCSSCMAPVCQAYVSDCSSNANLASNLGVFQGLSIGGAFILAFPIGGLLGAKFGPRLPIFLAAGFQCFNALIAALVTPESNTVNKRIPKPIRFSEVNPISGLQRLFGIGNSSKNISSVSLLRSASIAYFSVSMARGALDAQFVNYANIRFGWSQAQSGPVLVMTGIMLAIVPRFLVPCLGMNTSINLGMLVYAVGLSSAGLVAKASHFVASIAVIAIGCVAFPALQALLANLAPPGEAGAMMGAVGSLNELTGAIGSSMYATLLATFASSDSEDHDLLFSILPRISGMHFLAGAAFALIGWMVSSPGLNRHKTHSAMKMEAVHS